MKIKIYGMITIIALVVSCKKDNTNNSGVAALNVINATTGVASISINFSPSSLPYYKNPTSISYASSLEFGLPVGQNIINFISSADTSNILFHTVLNLKLGAIYSLYLIGQPSHTDTLFLMDNIPSYQDSVAGARFINLSDSQPLTVNLQGNIQKEFTNIGYKNITTFKKYPATSSITGNGGYNYEIRDAGGTVLTTFNWNPTVFKNNTLVITGLVSNSSISVFSVNHY